MTQDQPPDSIQSTVVGFSGHRSLSDPQYVGKKIEQNLADIKKTAANRTIAAAVSSAAAGADVLFCETALKLKIPLTVILPFSEEEFKKDFTGVHTDWWPRAKRIIETCRDQGACHIIGPQSTRDESYRACGQACVDRATHLLVVATTKDTGSKVGAHAMIEYARSTGRKTIVINPDSTLEAI